MNTKALAAAAGRRTRRHRPEILLLVATLVLFGFYYLARADVIGTRGPGRTWFTVTAPALSPTMHFAISAVLLALIPVAAARWLCGVSLRDLGLGLGKWREGLAWLAIGVPLALIAGMIGAGSPAMRAVYPLDPAVSAAPGSFVPHALRNFLYFASWEVLFRGVLLFGFEDQLGRGAANATQTGLSVVAHFGRAMTETFSAIPAGLVFGWINLRVRSVWYVALIHWIIGTSMDWFIVSA